MTTAYRIKDAAARTGFSVGCVGEPTEASAAQMVGSLPEPTPAGSSLPIVCTLDHGALRGRLDEWQLLLSHVASRETVDGGIRATFSGSVPTHELIRLVAAEQDCCQFLRFAITVDTRGVALEIRAPADGEPIVHALFGTGG